jgi:TolB-like protein/cytochrome c-type biogenesis protein CcmH/NrfG
MMGGWWPAGPVAVAAIAAIRLSAQCGDGSPPPCRSATAAPTSVAVLYFVSLSRDSADAYLADGLSEEIATSLGRIVRLRVMGSSAVRSLQRRMLNNPAVIGRALQVRYLVDGTVQPSGNRVRVRVQLINATSGMLVWSSGYSRPSADLLEMQEEIARDVAVNVAGSLLPAERVSLAARQTRDPEAYDHYLRGNFYLARRSSDSFQRAVTEYQTALRHDPLFSRARARLAYAHALGLDWGWALPGLAPEVLLDHGIALADTVIAADPTNSEAWMARGYLLEFREAATFEGVSEAFARAIARDSTNAEAWHQYGSALALIGADSSAIAAFGRALALDPGRGVTWMELSEAVTLAGDARRGLALLDSAVATDPTNGIYLMSRAKQHLLLGDTAGARADAAGAARLDTAWGWPRNTVLARILAAAGDTAAARVTLAPILSWLRDPLARPAPGVPRSAGSPVVGPVTATVPALLAIGERDLALRYLEALRPEGVRLWHYLRWPTCDALRTEPRFQALVAASRPPPP